MKESEFFVEKKLAHPATNVADNNIENTLLLNENAKNDIIIRLKRIEGQARGVQRMIEDGRSCEDIIIQVAALKAAITQAGVAIAGSHMVECILSETSPKGIECQDKIKDFARLFSKLA